MISHWDDGSGMTAILSFELTVAWLGWHLVALRKLPDQGGEKPSDWLGPQNGSRDSFPSVEIENKKVSCLAGFVGGRTKKPSIPGEEDKKNICGHEGPKFLKPVLKIA